MKTIIETLKASKRKAKHQRDNWKRRAVEANKLLERWVEWCKREGQSDFTGNLFCDTNSFIKQQPNKKAT